ncbi:MAG: BatA and WFA domain-containing protein [Nanoarchaeota archaeon]|nr:BatA and WFA domain-containing protein [Nanoarchaeota archaeon]MBU1704353.1 BatA and WFA domain-containing protein [Nanoarchaeota archaeon]
MMFNNPLGLYAFLALIPFILLYLIRPKPRKQMIPSLMFFLQNKKKIKENAFLRKLLHNLLFFLQLLALLGIIFAVASPYIIIPYDESSEKTVIILDASASMATKSGMGTRFSKAVSEAKNKLSGDVSLILAENIPLVLLENEKPSTAINILNHLRPKATTTNLGDAMLAAQSLVKEKSQLFVISDFSNTDGTDIFLAKRILEAKEIRTTFIDVSNDAANIGIVDLSVSQSSITATVKNYGEDEASFKIRLGDSSKDVKISALSKDTFIFDNPPAGISEITIDVDDGLELDNKAYISLPEDKIIDVLLITNADASHLMAALGASKNVNLEIRRPPVTNAYNIKHDIVVLNAIDPNLFVPADFNDLKKFVESGGKLIITGQPDLEEFDTKGLLPVTINGLKQEQGIVCTDVIHPITKIFEESTCFAGVSSYLDVSEHSTTLASIGDIPLMSIKDLGKGKVLYYGIFDELSDFKTTPNYPIFWYNLIKYLMDIPELNDFNVNTGRILPVSGGVIKTPTTTLEMESVLIDESGIYEFDNKKVASNLLSETESDIGRKIDIETKEAEFREKQSGIEFKLDLNTYLLALVLLILIIELIYLKKRGDI